MGAGRPRLATTAATPQRALHFEVSPTATCPRYAAAEHASSGRHTADWNSSNDNARNVNAKRWQRRGPGGIGYTNASFRHS